MKKFFIIAGSFFIFMIIALSITVKVILQDPEFGGNPLKERGEILRNSSNFRGGHFHNNVQKRDYDFWVNIKDMMGDQKRTPPGPFPLVKPKFSEKIFSGLRAVWFGHASVLVEIDGYRIFFDPMLSDTAFPVKAVAPKRMNPSPLKLEELPKIDVVIITHDHFDHLDMKTVQYLNKRESHFYVGLGVGAHLEKWKIKPNKINELDWGDSINFKNLTINCTEARHYSGRKSVSNNNLWTSWVVQGPKHSVFHSGDYGIDLEWQDIHMIPENSVKSHKDIGAKVMLPIHWGVFQLSYHAWDEPIERTLASAKKNNIKIVTPKIGETFNYGKPIKNELWWRSLEN